MRGVRLWVGVRGPRWDRFLAAGAGHYKPPDVAPTDAAAVIFTSGSTGPAKGVAYEHGMFLSQIDLLRAGYELPGGQVDVPAFPLFALFDVGLRATMVVPRMQTHRPAWVDPAEITGPTRELGAGRVFGSPAFWKRVLPAASPDDFRTVTALLSAGAPVPPSTHELARRVLPYGAELHTPYGATEALPVCTIGTNAILGAGGEPGLGEDAKLGRGTCVGRPFPGVAVRIIEESDGPVARTDDATDLPPGEIGEIIVASPAVTRAYMSRPAQTRRAKIIDPAAPTGVWHRMGDVGYKDAAGRVWFCGRQSHVVRTPDGPCYPVMVEGVLNADPAVGRSAVVGVPTPGGTRPVAVVELAADFTGDRRAVRDRLRTASCDPPQPPLAGVLFHQHLPTDVRHNTKIDRPALGRWAAKVRGSAVRRRLAGA